MAPLVEPKIALISILTDDVTTMRDFYRDVLGFGIALDLGRYVEFESEGVRFALSARETLAQATGREEYSHAPQGHAFELAFPCASPSAVDEAYNTLIKRGATAIKPPADMPWGQRTAFFADPDGNIHEIFANLPT